MIAGRQLKYTQFFGEKPYKKNLRLSVDKLYYNKIAKYLNYCKSNKQNYNNVPDKNRNKYKGEK